jgi:hypothetical protein
MALVNPLLVTAVIALASAGSARANEPPPDADNAPDQTVRLTTDPDGVAIPASTPIANTPPAPDAIVPLYEPTIGLFGDANHLGGIQAGGFGLDVEIARRIGRHNIQLFGEAAVAWLAVGVLSKAQSGIQGRLGAGGRWYPVTWGDNAAGIDLYLEAGVGETGYWWAPGTFSRPDESFGWGFNIRAPRGRDGEHVVALRSGLRAMLAHDRSEPDFVCRGCTVSRPQTVDGGLLYVMAVSWW